MAWALTEAKRRGTKVVVTDETTPTSHTVANPDGTFTTELTAGPERIWKNGTWQKVDATLARNADGSITPKAHPNALRLGGKGGSLPKSVRAAQDDPARDLVTLRSGDDEVTLRWKGGLPEPELDGTRARYRDAVPGADVVVEATRTGFEQFVEIGERPTGSYSYTLPVKAKGLRAKANKDGSVTFTDSRTGAARATMPAPVMWDATTDKTSGEHTHRARVDMKVVDRGAGEVDLVVTPSAEFLSDPATKFPVTVDPSTSALSNTFDTYVQQGETVDWSTDVELDFGNPGTKNPDGTPRIARSFITWNTTPIQDALIVDTNLALWNFHSGNTDCTAQKWTVWATGAPSTSSRWSSQPAWNDEYHSSTQTRGNQDCTATQPDGWINADVDELVQSWASAKATRGHMGLRAATDDVKAWKRVNSANATANQPRLSVTYNYRPSDGTDRQAGAPFKSYAGVWAVNTTTPTLRDTFTDPDGDTVDGTFQVYDAATNTPITTPAGEGLIVSGFVASGKPASVTVPAGQLQDGRTYKFRTNAYDGTHYNLSWSPWTQFVVDTTAPGAPAKMTSATYPEGQWGGSAGTPGRFDVETGDDGAREVRYRLDAIADLDEEEELDDGVTTLRPPALLADTWQSVAAVAGNAAFEATPATIGSHYVEAATVDRADNVGEVRAYGFRAGTGPRRVNHVVDIALPKPQNSDGTWQQVEGTQPIPDWSPDAVILEPASAASVKTPEGRPARGPGKERCEDSGTTRICSKLELREVLRPGAKGADGKDDTAPSGVARADATPAPIIPYCSQTGASADGTFTRTEACLGYRYTYRAIELSSNQPPKLKGVAVFEIQAQVLTDVKSKDIKFWARFAPQPLLPSEPPVTGSIKIQFSPTCDFGCTSSPTFDWDGPMTWNGSYPTDPHEQTGTATMTWDTALDDLDTKGPHDDDRQRSFPIDFRMQIDTSLDGVKPQYVKFENGTFSARCDAANINNMPPGCVFPANNPGWVIDPVTYPAAAVHAELMAAKLPGFKGSDYSNPLHYLPMTKKGKPQRNRFDRSDQQNRRVICGRSGPTGFVPHDKTALFDYLRTPKPGQPDPKDKPSCDEYAFNATYESAGMPKTPDGNDNPFLVANGEECVQTYEGVADDGTLHFRDDGRYPEPDWSNVKCGRSSMSLEVNSGAMRLFGQFAAANRLLDADGYYVWTGLKAAGCDWTAATVICNGWANGFPDRGLSAP
ncbi:DNRLRE domain-containing protein [Streptomyces sp. NPDC087512]|uniref:DNRLRE domain-containing protein n=1 Tax=Streptomyces sp. NPDC087512 TaxID=3155059 RepID=UPI00342F6352